MNHLCWSWVWLRVEFLLARRWATWCYPQSWSRLTLSHWALPLLPTPVDHSVGGRQRQDVPSSLRWHLLLSPIGRRSTHSWRQGSHGILWMFQTGSTPVRTRLCPGALETAAVTGGQGPWPLMWMGTDVHMSWRRWALAQLCLQTLCSPSFHASSASCLCVYGELSRRCPGP